MLTEKVEIEEFTHHPGVYYEKIGSLHPPQSSWKLVIQINITSIEKRAKQIKSYIQETENICQAIPSIHKNMCQSLYQVIQESDKKLNKEIVKINTLYQTSKIQKRGLIDGLGTIAKTLIGTMDANDEKIIKEQLAQIQNDQQTIRHAFKNQIKILEETIGHIDNTEKTIENNENTLANITQKLKEQLSANERQNGLHEHFIIINAILADLTRDIRDILDYLTLIKQGIMLPRLVPIANILQNLRDANTQLTEGLYFPFSIKENKWYEIEKIATINAYYNDGNIFTILRFPLISHTQYEILNVVPLPVPNHGNMFTIVEIKNHLIAINIELRAYIILSADSLQLCKTINRKYLCERNLPIHRVNGNSICEIDIYLENKSQQKNCNTINIESNNTFWIPLHDTHSWLFSSPVKQQISIKCKDHGQVKNTIENTGKISLKNNCELKTNEITLRTEKIVYETKLESFLPEYNISLAKDERKTDSPQQTEIKKVIQDPSKLKDLKKELKMLNNELDNNSHFQSKAFIYPMATSGSAVLLAILIAIGVIIYIVKKKRSQPEKRVTIKDTDNDFRLPRPILKHRHSTRF